MPLKMGFVMDMFVFKWVTGRGVVITYNPFAIGRALQQKNHQPRHWSIECVLPSRGPPCPETLESLWRKSPPHLHGDDRWMWLPILHVQLRDGSLG